MSGPVTAVHHGLEAVPAAPSVVTIGNFDGVHRGHRVLLRRAVDTARDRGVRSVVVTFDPHPAAVLRPGSQPPALQTTDQRVAALVDAEPDVVVVLPFTTELAARTPAGFVTSVLHERLRAVRVIVGTNFRFGHRAVGDVVTLVEQGEVHGFEVEAVALLELDGRPISSTAVREHLQAGEVDWVRRALGRAATLTGRVVPGDGRGTTIGVPTANLALPVGLALPADGVYAGHAEVAGERLPAVTNVGRRPTFDGQGRTVEVHLIGTGRDLYDRELAISFETRLRGERRFDGPEALVAQIRADIAAARGHLGVDR